MKNKILILLTVLIALSSRQALAQECHMSETNHVKHEANKEVVSEDKNYLKAKKITKIDDEYSFKYEFASKPKIGTAILKIVVMKDEKSNGDLRIVGNYDMPSMRGAHPSGDVEFKKNKKEEYLLPVNLVMPGVWEIDVVFYDGDKEIYSGAISLKI